MYRTLLIFLFCLLPAALLHSQEPGITVSADKQKIVLGETFQLNLKAVYPSGSGIKTGFDSIAHFEFSAEPKKDSSVANQLVTLNIVYTLTSFDSGHWVIPALVLNNKWHSDSIPIDVQFSDFDTSQPYHSIKDILEVSVEKKTDWYWYLIGGAVVLAIVIVYLRWRKKGNDPVVVKEGLDPYKEAILELKKLNTENLEPKLYYSKLVLVLRIYLKRKKNIQSLQKTTADLLIKIKELSLSREELDKLGQALRMADMVKFAKYIPEVTDRETSFIAISSVIGSIESASVSSIPQ